MNQPTVLYEYTPPSLNKYMVQRYSEILQEWMDAKPCSDFEEAKEAAETLGNHLGARTRVIDLEEGGNLE